MAQDTDTSPPPTPSVPTFGRHTDTAEERTYRRFGMEVEGKKRRNGREERWTEEFDAFTDVDGGMWVAMGQARDEMTRARAVVSFLGANLRDDDGASMDYVFPAEPEREDPDDPDSDWVRADPTEDNPDGEPLFIGWDGELYPHDELPPLVELRDGSSRRRFAYISDAMHIRYKFEALEEIANWLTEGMTGRPTKQPANSGRGQQRTSRGSGGKRRAS
jgi:hypothetical protein